MLLLVRMIRMNASLKKKQLKETPMGRTSELEKKKNLQKKRIISWLNCTSIWKIVDHLLTKYQPLMAKILNSTTYTRLYRRLKIIL